LARYYFDTSAFTKFYHPEVGSARVTKIVQDPASVLQISNLAILETQSAFAMKVRTAVLDQAHAEAAMDKVFKDLATGLFFAVKLDESHVDDARALVRKYGYARRMRTLDALQLAVALDLRRRNLVDTFVVADKLLAEIAMLEALVVENPEDTP
jgi:hypothetical protein